MAVRLSKAFGGSPGMWLRLQANYELAQVRQGEIEVERYRRVLTKGMLRPKIGE
jgi:plasmid maintenance system antidote protein VapI